MLILDVRYSLPDFPVKFLSAPMTSCVLPVPVGPTSMAALPMTMRCSIQNVADAVSAVGTVTYYSAHGRSKGAEEPGRVTLEW